MVQRERVEIELVVADCLWDGYTVEFADASSETLAVLAPKRCAVLGLGF